MNKLVKDYYEDIFGAVTSRLNFDFNPTENQNKQISNFVKLLEKNIGMESLDEDFIFYFIAFQFERKHDQKTRFGKGRIPLNHVIGNKAYERWLRKPDNWKHWVDKFLKKYDITPPFKEIEISDDIFDLIESEENIKATFKDSNTLFMQCSELTTLYHPKSKYCIKCDLNKICADLQKSIYPKIHGARKR